MGKNVKKRPVLETAGNIFKALAFLVVFVGIAGFVLNLEDLFAAGLDLFYSLIVAILLFGFGEMVHVLIAIDGATRRTLELVKEMKRSA